MTGTWLGRLTRKAQLYAVQDTYFRQKDPANNYVSVRSEPDSQKLLYAACNSVQCRVDESIGMGKAIVSVPRATPQAEIKKHNNNPVYSTQERHN